MGCGSCQAFPPKNTHKGTPSWWSPYACHPHSRVSVVVLIYVLDMGGTWSVAAAIAPVAEKSVDRSFREFFQDFSIQLCFTSGFPRGIAPTRLRCIEPRLFARFLLKRRAAQRRALPFLWISIVAGHAWSISRPFGAEGKRDRLSFQSSSALFRMQNSSGRLLLSLAVYLRPGSPILDDAGIFSRPPRFLPGEFSETVSVYPGHGNTKAGNSEHRFSP